MEEILRRILSIEAEAKATVSEAQEVATMLKEQIKEEVDKILAQAREEAEREAKAMREKARQEAEKEREHILSQAEESLRGLEEEARLNFGKAVSYVVEAICGQGGGLKGDRRGISLCQSERPRACLGKLSDK